MSKYMHTCTLLRAHNIPLPTYIIYIMYVPMPMKKNCTHACTSRV